MFSVETQRGFSLMEVLIGSFLSTLLMSGIIVLLGESVSTYRMQLSQGSMETSSRIAHDVLSAHITQAGFMPDPWQVKKPLPAITNETLNGESLRGDRLGLQHFSTRNCYGNDNPVTDKNGKPVFFVLRTRFYVNTKQNLAMHCSYGPDLNRLKTEMKNFGLIEGVEAMQLLFAEDRNGDNIADGWVSAQTWDQESDIQAVKVGLLLSTQQPNGQPTRTQFSLLDESVRRPADGKLRKVTTFTSAIRSRLK